MLEELEHKYNLTFGVKPGNEDGLFMKYNELLTMSNLKSSFQTRRWNMLKDKIDVTAFVYSFLVNYHNREL